jgi:xanthosine utilization system XapX-like protein
MTLLVHLADPNPVLLALMGVVALVVAVLFVMWVREVDRNGRAQEARCFTIPLSDTTDPADIFGPPIFEDRR